MTPKGRSSLSPASLWDNFKAGNLKKMKMLPRRAKLVLLFLLESFGRAAMIQEPRDVSLEERDRVQTPETGQKKEVIFRITYYIDPSKKHDVTPSASSLLSNLSLA